MSEEYAIEVQNVSKQFKLPHEKVSSIKSLITQARKRKRGYEVQKALNHINFKVKKGEFFGIVGRNGSGKSTLLKILAEIYQPSEGAVKTNGKLVPFIELGVGFNPELSGRENVYLNGALLGFSKREVDEMYEDIVQFAELERFMDQKLKNYSSGMQVRLAFSVATRAKADILLVDEVLAVGDADFQRKCFNYFKQLKKNKKTVVFVSHDMNAVREYCDRAVLIEKSEIIESGNVAKVASSYTKLFMNEEGTSEEKIARKRWGNGAIEISKVKINPNNISHEDKVINIGIKAKIKRTVKDPIFGFTVKNGAGTEMLGTNSKLLHVNTGDYRDGDNLEVLWSMPNILNDGDYIVDVTAIDGDSLEEYDWWEDAISFRVTRTEHTAYVVEPPVEISLKRQ